jgi:chromosome segregation ATPase
MKQTWKIVLVLIAGGLGVWGCARNPSGQTSPNERIRQLEARCVKLEKDYGTVANARDAALKETEGLKQAQARLQEEHANQLKAVQGELAGVQKQLQQRSAERDTLMAQVNERTSERDGLLQRMDKVKKGLRELLTQEEAPGASTAGPSLPGALGIGGGQ